MNRLGIEGIPILGPDEIERLATAERLPTVGEINPNINRDIRNLESIRDRWYENLDYADMLEQLRQRRDRGSLVGRIGDRAMARLRKDYPEAPDTGPPVLE